MWPTPGARSGIPATAIGRPAGRRRGLVLVVNPSLARIGSDNTGCPR